MARRTLFLHPQAPRKPAIGAACNGCGVCCAYAPCPLGVLRHGRWRGACPALRWDTVQTRYRCMAAEAEGLFGRLARRWISAGSGCDCALELVDETARSD